MAKKIMIVDDEQDVLTYLGTLFKDNGYETETAIDGKEGFEKINKFRPDLVILDIIMPNKSGVGLYRELKKNEITSKIPVIILSGVVQYQKFFARDHFNIPKPVAFVEKPFVQSELIELVKKTIG